MRRWLEALKRLAEDTKLPLRSLVIGKDASMVWKQSSVSKSFSWSSYGTTAWKKMERKRLLQKLELLK